jgi:putative transposase
MVTIAFKGSHFERDVILWGVRWYVAYPLSYRQIEEMMEERGVEVDHSTESLGPQICAGFGEGVPGA